MKDIDIQSPFKFLDSFDRKDYDKFYGRDKEVAMLFDYVNKNRVVLVYGQSGTGKTSIIKCGLSNCFESTDWIPLFLKRDGNINDSLLLELKRNNLETDSQKILEIETKLFEDSPLPDKTLNWVLNDEEKTNPTSPLRFELDEHQRHQVASVIYYIQKLSETYLRPVYLILDQFEELLIYGTDSEKACFIEIVKFLVTQKASSGCHIVIIIREEYFAWLNDFETVIPEIGDRRLRIEPVRRKEAEIIIRNSCKKFNITLEKPQENINQIIQALTKHGDVSLPYLQVYLDQLWKIDYKRTYPDGYKGTDSVPPLVFSSNEINELGAIEDVFLRYVADCLSEIQNVLNRESSSSNSKTLYDILDLLVSKTGTKNPLQYLILNNSYTFPSIISKLRTLEEKLIIKVLKLLETYRIVRDDGKAFELAHDSMGPIIQKLKSQKFKRPRLLIHERIENPYKGLLSYDQGDRNKFFGRDQVIQDLLTKLENRSLVAVVGPSGSGKSSVVKAGVIPRLNDLGYKIICLKPEDLIKGEIISISQLESEILDPSSSNILLYIDQFEQIITRYDSQDRYKKGLFKFLHKIENEIHNKNNKTVKIILSVRDDYEHEFDKFENWREDKFNIPPFNNEELSEVIREPAYLAGLEFFPDSLVDIIIRDVQRSKGTLPLLSYTLSRMYDSYKFNGVENGLLTQEIYNDVGGVIGGLQTKANKIYEAFNISDPHRKTIRNVILRMTSSLGERAGKKVYKKELDYNSNEENKRVSRILQELIDSRLIVSAKDKYGEEFYEPAHDFLVKYWSKISEWASDQKIQDIFHYIPLLKDAVKDWQNQNVLWDNNYRLKALTQIVESEDNWLNKTETQFVLESDSKKKQKRRLLILSLVSIFTLCVIIIGSLYNIIDDKSKIETRLILQKEPFFSSDLDSAKKDEFLDLLISLKHGQSDTLAFDQLKTSLNIISKAVDEAAVTNPNKALFLAKQSLDKISPTNPGKKILDSIGLHIANRSLFYTHKVTFKYKVGSSIYITALSQNKINFAFATLNGIRTGKIRNDSIFIDDEVVSEEVQYEGYSSSGRNKEKRFKFLTYTNDNNLIAITDDNLLYRWNNSNKNPTVEAINTVKKFPDQATTIISHDGNKIIQYSSGSDIRLIDYYNKGNSHDIAWDSENIITSINFSPDCSRILIRSKSPDSVKSITTYWVYETAIRRLTQLPIKNILSANFLADNRSILLDIGDSISVSDFYGNKLFKSISKRSGIYESNNNSQMFLSDNWENLVIPNHKYGYRYFFKEVNNRRERVFSLLNTDSIKISQVAAHGIFGILNNNNLLAYSKSELEGGVYSFNIMIYKSHKAFQHLDDAFEEIDPFSSLSSYDKKDIGLDNTDVNDLYNKVVELFTISSDKSYNRATQKMYLIQAKDILKNLLTIDYSNENYINALKVIDRQLYYSIDSNFISYATAIKYHIELEKRLLTRYSKDSISIELLEYKKTLADDLGNLSFYLLFDKQVDLSDVLKAANEGLKLDSSNTYIYTNIAICYILQENFDSAKKIYENFKHSFSSELNMSFKDAFLKDFERLERRGILTRGNLKTYNFVQSIKCFLKDIQNCKF